MNLVHLVSVLSREGINVACAIGTDFSHVMIEAARREAKNYLGRQDLHRLKFHIANNESLVSDLSASTGTEKSKLSVQSRGGEVHIRAEAPPSPLVPPIPEERASGDVTGAVRRALAHWSAAANIKFIEAVSKTESISAPNSGGAPVSSRYPPMILSNSGP